jgi:hypothetical protein
MMDKTREPRKDKGSKRVPAVQDPERITLYLAGHGVEARIASALKADLKLKKKQNPDAIITKQDILKDWLCDHLGLERE